MTVVGRPVRALLLFAALLFLFVPALTPATAAHASPDTKSKLTTARTQAEHLRAALALLRGRSDRTDERLAYARQQLAGTATRAISAEQQQSDLQAADADANAAVARRVRAIEQSGGTMALYAEAWTGASITDVSSNLAALNAVLGTLSSTALQTTVAADRATRVHHQLDRKATSRAALVRRVADLADTQQRLVAAQRKLLRHSDRHIRDLARELSKEREAAAEASAAAGYNLPKGSLDAADNPYAAKAVVAALSKLGSPYVWGAEGPNTFDCSGLVQWSYAQAGLTLPRLASDQFFASTPVAVSAMQPGDLLVYAYDTSRANTIHHITMYIGNGKMVEAPHTGDVVHVVPVYYDGLFGVGRPGL